MKRLLLQDALLKKAIEAQANTGGAIAGATIDRLGYQSAILGLNYAAASGSPSAAVTALTIYHDDASNMGTEVLFATLASALVVMTAGEGNYNIDLARAKRYIRFKWDATYTDGSTPGNVVSAVCALGDKTSGPVAASITVTQ